MVTKAAPKKVAPQEVITLGGNEAVGWGGRLSRVNLTFFLPIGPADEVANTMGQFYSRGELAGKILSLESEDANFAAMAAAAKTGMRCMFATNSSGIAKAMPCMEGLGHHRIPLLMPIPQRNFGGGAAVRPEWADMLACRDFGFIMLQAECAQELLDMVPQMYKVGEHPDVQLPLMMGYEGWEISHSQEPVSIPAQGDIDKFLPPYGGPKFTWEDWREVHSTRLSGYGGGGMTPDAPPAAENKYLTTQALARGKEVLKQVDEEYGRLFGRRWGGVLDASHVGNAEVVIVTMGAMLPACRIAADVAREMGTSAGVLKLRLVNPFPAKEVAEALKGAKAVVTLDRDEMAFLYHMVRSSVFSLKPQPKVIGRLLGMAERGAIAEVDQFVSFIEDGAKAARGEKVIELGWLFRGTREQQGVMPHPGL